MKKSLDINTYPNKGEMNETFGDIKLLKNDSANYQTSSTLNKFTITPNGLPPKGLHRKNKSEDITIMSGFNKQKLKDLECTKKNYYLNTSNTMNELANKTASSKYWKLSSTSHLRNKSLANTRFENSSGFFSLKKSKISDKVPENKLTESSRRLGTNQNDPDVTAVNHIEEWINNKDRLKRSKNKPETEGSTYFANKYGGNILNQQQNFDGYESFYGKSNNIKQRPEDLTGDNHRIPKLNSNMLNLITTYDKPHNCLVDDYNGVGSISNSMKYNRCTHSNIKAKSNVTASYSVRAEIDNREIFENIVKQKLQSVREDTKTENLAVDYNRQKVKQAGQTVLGKFHVLSKNVFQYSKLSTIYDKIHSDLKFANKNSNRFINHEFSESDRNDKLANEILLKNSKKREMIKDFSNREKLYKEYLSIISDENNMDRKIISIQKEKLVLQENLKETIKKIMDKYKLSAKEALNFKKAIISLKKNNELNQNSVIKPISQRPIPMNQEIIDTPRTRKSNIFGIKDQNPNFPSSDTTALQENNAADTKKIPVLLQTLGISLGNEQKKQEITRSSRSIIKQELQGYDLKMSCAFLFESMNIEIKKKDMEVMKEMDKIKSLKAIKKKFKLRLRNLYQNQLLNPILAQERKIDLFEIVTFLICIGCFISKQDQHQEFTEVEKEYIFECMDLKRTFQEYHNQVDEFCLKFSSEKGLNPIQNNPNESSITQSKFGQISMTYDKSQMSPNSFQEPSAFQSPQSNVSSLVKMTIKTTEDRVNQQICNFQRHSSKILKPIKILDYKQKEPITKWVEYKREEDELQENSKVSKMLMNSETDFCDIKSFRFGQILLKHTEKKTAAYEAVMRQKKADEKFINSMRDQITNKPGHLLKEFLISMKKRIKMMFGTNEKGNEFFNKIIKSQPFVSDEASNPEKCEDTFQKTNAAFNKKNKNNVKTDFLNIINFYED